MTNYEKIKAMSVERLAAELLWSIALYANYICKNLFGVEKPLFGDKFVQEHLSIMIKHLESEAEEDV